MVLVLRHSNENHSIETIRANMSPVVLSAIDDSDDDDDEHNEKEEVDEEEEDGNVSKGDGNGEDD